LRHPAPRLGEHTVQLLDEYGFSRDEIETILLSGGAWAAQRAQPENEHAT
jgi:formyl-CoA transferase